jgi:hypothetical protein
MAEEKETISPQAASQDGGTTMEAILSPFCRELRTKRYFFLQEIATEAHQLQGPSNHCWCRLTMQTLGPDREFVHPNHCGPGRACYRSAFETS